MDRDGSGALTGGRNWDRANKKAAKFVAGILIPKNCTACSDLVTGVALQRAQPPSRVKQKTHRGVPAGFLTHSSRMRFYTGVSFPCLRTASCIFAITVRGIRDLVPRTAVPLKSRESGEIRGLQPIHVHGVTHSWAACRPRVVPP